MNLNLNTKIPPPIITTLCVGLVYAASLENGEYVTPARLIRLISYAFITLGGSLMFAACVEFYRARTSINPMRPDAANALITSGIFRFSRNPIYLGDAIWIFASGVWFQTLWVLPILVGFIWYIHRFQIEPEELVLTQKFGDSFLKYQSKVRRWF